MILQSLTVQLQLINELAVAQADESSESADVNSVDDSIAIEQPAVIVDSGSASIQSAADQIDVSQRFD